LAGIHAAADFGLGFDQLVLIRMKTRCPSALNGKQCLGGAPVGRTVAGGLISGIVGLNAGIVLGTPALIQDAIGDGAFATQPILAFELMALFSGVLTTWPDMNLRLAVDPLLLQRTMIDTLVASGAKQRVV